VGSPEALDFVVSGNASQEWRSIAEAIRLMARGRTMRAAAPVAAVVGTLLSWVNEGSGLISGTLTSAVLVRIVVDYSVPFLVASSGYLMATRLPPESSTALRSRANAESSGS
jgi:short subunit fatty acids transporter